MPSVATHSLFRFGSLQGDSQLTTREAGVYPEMSQGNARVGRYSFLTPLLANAALQSSPASLGANLRHAPRPI
jgi:hypothetical protein